MQPCTIPVSHYIWWHEHLSLCLEINTKIRAAPGGQAVIILFCVPVSVWSCNSTVA